jgi:hypothetical protein
MADSTVDAGDHCPRRLAAIRNAARRLRIDKFAERARRHLPDEPRAFEIHRHIRVDRCSLNRLVLAGIVVIYRDHCARCKQHSTTPEISVVSTDSIHSLAHFVRCGNSKTSGKYNKFAAGLIRACFILTLTLREYSLLNHFSNSPGDFATEAGN